MKVSTRGDYAARALLSMALHGGEQPTSVKEIAERTGLPQPYLEQILLAVKGAGLVRSKRGVGGGYVLARIPDEITLAEIVAAVDGPIVTELSERDHQEGHCVLQDVWIEASEGMRELLDGVTLTHLVKRAVIGHSAAEHADHVEHAEIAELVDHAEPVDRAGQEWGSADPVERTSAG